MMLVSLQMSLPLVPVDSATISHKQVDMVGQAVESPPTTMPQQDSPDFVEVTKNCLDEECSAFSLYGPMPSPTFYMDALMGGVEYGPPWQSNLGRNVSLNAQILKDPPCHS